MVDQRECDEIQQQLPKICGQHFVAFRSVAEKKLKRFWEQSFSRVPGKVVQSAAQIFQKRAKN